MDYIKINKESWNARTKVHVDSEFYGIQDFLDGKSSLNQIELPLLGSIKNKELLHLQCHFGMDSISLQRMGANVTAVDFSEVAIEEANKLNIKTKSEVTFICSDIYLLNLSQTFDMIFSSYGVIGWLPDIDKWAEVISRHLKPGGKFVFAEFHPVVWMFDNHFKNIIYKYSKDTEIVEMESGTYADKSADINFKTVCWNHSLSEVIAALIRHGLNLRHFEEYDYSPYNCFAETEEFEKGKFRIKHLGNKIPMVYSLVAEKNK